MEHYPPFEIFNSLFQKNSTVRDALLRRRDIEKRNKIKKRWLVRKLTGIQRQRAKRAIEGIIREPKTYRKDKRRLQKSDILLALRKFKASHILDTICPERNRKEFWLPLSKRYAKSRSEVNLTEFSFIHNPHKTMEGLRDIIYSEAKDVQATINFKDETCLDVAPYMLLVEFWHEMLPVFEGGEMDIPVQKVLSAVGIGYALNVTFGGVVDYNDVWVFPLTRRRKVGETKSKNRFADVPTRDEATDRFCDALDEWLGIKGIEMALTPSGRYRFKSILSELLENAERHSDGERGDGSWAVSGFLEKQKDGSTFRANLGILSVGDTFSESLCRATPEMQRDISSYISIMRRIGAKQSDETLSTLAALQDGITCVPAADRDNRGGTGLMEMLDLVCALGQSNEIDDSTHVVILSGRSCISLRKPYDRGYRASGMPNPPRVQWFNNANSAHSLPDERFVFDLRHRFPGTVISVNFTLDPSHLHSILSESANGS